MRLIVGLGNPGAEYEQTPHNMGYLAVDVLAERAGVEMRNRRGRALTARARIGDEEVLLVKPETFMNLSGNSVRELAAQLEAEGGFEAGRDLIVIYDELDFPLGTVRIRERGSSGGHNGAESVIGAVGPEFVRIRVGIGPEHEVSDGAKYVLTTWKKKDLAAVGEALERAADAAEMIVKQGTAAAMNRFNRRDDGTPAQE